MVSHARLLWSILLLVAAGLSANGAELTMWSLPVADLYPAGIALDGSMLYAAAAGGMETYRLDPDANVFRTWGVGDEPQDVVVVDGIPFTTVRSGSFVVSFHPDSLATTTSTVPFPDVSVGEIHRGLDTDEGHAVLWIAEMGAAGFLRFEHDPLLSPTPFGHPQDREVDSSVISIDATVVEVGHEIYDYDTSLIPDPEPFAAGTTSPPYTEWRLSLGDDVRVTDIAAAHDGTLWISAGLPFLLRYDPVAETLQWLETIQNVWIFQGLLPAPDGSIWLSNLVEGSIGHLNAKTGLSEVWRIPGTEEVYDMAFDGQGNIWYTDRVGDAIGRLSPQNGTADVFLLPEGSGPLYVAVGDTGDVWFSAGSGNFLGRLKVRP